MKVIIVKDYNEMSRLLAETVASEVQNNPHSALGLATGSSPLGAYRLLVEFCRKKQISFRNVRTVNLDEYVGLGEQDGQSYVSFMRQNLFDLVDVQPSNTHMPNGLAENLQEECLRYSQILQQNVPDLQILGLGSNGHIGFNEPNTPINLPTHVVQLAESTVRDNSRFFPDGNVPTRAITMGIAEIMRARKIVVVANGENKAEAVYKMVLGEVSEVCPASILQTHPDCTVIVDKSAAKFLQ